MTQTLQAEASALRSWLIDAALPFWAKQGRDANGGFYEDLTLERAPNVGAIRRVRVQSRQIFVYAQAARLGWYDGAPIADKTYEFLEQYGYQKDGGNNSRSGYAHRIGPDYSVTNGLRDFYDHAFHLLGAATLSALPQAKQAKAARERCDHILGFVDVELEAENEGWMEGNPASLPRRQNPHMHYFEACMALYQVTADAKHLRPAQHIFGLFEHYFFDGHNAVVSEFFNQDWTLAGGDLGQTAEPGHAAEWVWLLGQYETLTGHSTAAYAAALYDKAFIGNPIFLNDEEDKSGLTRRATKRLWVQTEVIRAHLAMIERGHTEAEAQAVRAIQAFREHYLHDDGSWTDQLSPEGTPCAATIPVSTFYHVMGMITEAVKVSKA